MGLISRVQLRVNSLYDFVSKSDAGEIKLLSVSEPCSWVIQEVRVMVVLRTAVIKDIEVSNVLEPLSVLLNNTPFPFLVTSIEILLTNSVHYLSYRPHE